MDITLIIYIILVIVLIVLAFKFIKKMLYAVITSVFIVLLSIVVLGGLVYLDVQSLTQIEDATINVVYLEDDEYVTGITIPISTEEQEVDVSSIQSYSQEEFNSDQSPEDDTFIITLKENAFNNVKGEDISLNNFIQDESFSQFIEDEITISTNSLQGVIESSSPQEEISDVILEEVDLGPLQDGARPLLVGAIEQFEESQDLGVREASFALMLQKLSEDEKNYIYLIRLFQDGEIEVKPNKLSFSILRYVPLSYIESQIVDSFNQDNSSMVE